MVDGHRSFQLKLRKRFISPRKTWIYKGHFTRCALLVLLTVSLVRVHAQEVPRIVLPTSQINACDFCLASQGISPLEAGSSGARVDLRYLHVGTIYTDGNRAENDRQELETHFTQQYSLFFALTSRFTVAALVPIAKRHSEELAEDGSVVTGNQFGLADISLLVRYKPLVSHTMENTTIVSLMAGVKLPTGRTDGRDSQGDLLDAHIQLGTGSTDMLTGVSAFLAWERTALILNVLGALTTDGANNHRFGNSLNYDLTVRYRIFPDDYQGTFFFATLGLNGEWRGKEIQDGLPDEDSGGNVLYLSPGIQFMFTPALSLEATYQYPVLHALNGRQLGEDYRIMTGLQLLF